MNKSTEFSITFKTTRPEYKWNSIKQTVEVVGEIDIQKEIESNMIEPLEVLFDKFTGVDTQVKREMQVVDRQLDRLDVALHSMQELERIRDKYKLSKDLSYEEVVKHVHNNYDKLTDNLNFIKSNIYKKEKKESEKVSTDEKTKQEKL